MASILSRSQCVNTHVALNVPMHYSYHTETPDYDIVLAWRHKNCQRGIRHGLFGLFSLNEDFVA